MLKNKNEKIYYNGSISRFYIDYKDREYGKTYIPKIKKIWENRNILLVEGDKTRSGVGNDLYSNAKSIRRILAPAENAYLKYDEILDEVKNNALKSDLILMALGPTASILAYDLYKLGFQAIDLGHLDIEYEWCRRNAEWKTVIEDKYVNEVNHRNVGESNNKEYLSQIIAKVI